MEADYTPLYLSSKSLAPSDEQYFQTTSTSSIVKTSPFSCYGIQTTWKRYRPVFLTASISGGLFLLALSFLLLLQAQAQNGDSPVPRLPVENVVFSNYTDFYHAPTPYNNGLWMDLLGPGMGFVVVDHPRQYGLPQGTKLPSSDDSIDAEIFGVSMYHQLHCLMIIRGLYYDALGNSAALAAHGAHGDGVDSDDDRQANLQHAAHCFDYLRQSIMCAGDMSLEGVAPDLDAHGKPHVNGMGMKHKCRRWESSKAWMDENAPAVRQGL